MRRSKSIVYLVKEYTASRRNKFLCEELALLDYLNLIDAHFKRFDYKTIIDEQLYGVPLTDEEVVDSISQSFYDIYLKKTLTKIGNCDLKELPCLVRKLLKVSKIYGSPSFGRTLNCLYSTILHCLFDRGIEDSSLLLTAWNTLCITGKLRINVFSQLIKKGQKHRSARILEYVIKSALYERFDFWGAWTKNHKLDSFHYCPVTAALLSGNVEHMNVLLKYGFEPNSQRRATYDRHFKFSSKNIYDWLRKPLVENTPPRQKIVTEVLLFLTSTAVSKSQLKRISKFRCFNLLWEVIPTPYVTKKELKKEILWRFLFSPDFTYGIFFPPSHEEFLRMFELYENVILLNKGAPVQPRSLKHLCKCTIRGEMQKSFNLPMGIDNLPIPKHLKQYLDVSL